MCGKNENSSILKAFNTYDLAPIFKFNLDGCYNNFITIDPTNYVIIANKNKIQGIEIIHQREHYIYFDIGHNKQCTLIV